VAVAALFGAGERISVREEFVLAVHGGTGSLAPERLTIAAERAVHAGLRRALLAGQAVLTKGGSATDAVVVAVMEIEDDPLFNAGVGSAFNTAGCQDMDAGVMDGRTLRMGMVLDVCGPRNPVQAALKLMQDCGADNALSAETAIEFCRLSDVPLEDERYFQTERRWCELQARLRRAEPSESPAERGERYGTVGAVALDRTGGLAAAASACGASTFLSGSGEAERQFGSAAWADASWAIAATGDGEHFLRPRLVKCIAARMSSHTTSLATATAQLVAEIGTRGGSGGLIGIDAAGRVTMPFNARGMSRGVARGDEAVKTAIFRETPRVLAHSHANAA